MEFVDRRTLSRHNSTPPSRDTATYPLRCGGNRHLAIVRQWSPNSIALASPSRVPHREPQTTCNQKTLILYTSSGYIDQQTKKFIRRGRDACLEATIIVTITIKTQKFWDKKSNKSIFSLLLYSIIIIIMIIIIIHRILSTITWRNIIINIMIRVLTNIL